jgi:amino acid adenylation domain-containing protein
MSDLDQRIADLSPQKRALLDLRLMKRGGTVINKQVIPRRGGSGPCPLSFAQQRLWFLNQFEPDSPIYNMPKAVRMSGALNAGALQQTLDVIVARHEALRTTFTSIDGNPVQVIAESQPIELTVIDLREWPEAQRDAEAQRWLEKEAQRPFDLVHDRPLRATLLRLDATEHVLLLTTHHIASDGWSTGVLISELVALYDAFADGQPSPLRELPIQYADFALWQRDWLQGEVLEAQLAYWRQQLGGSLPVLELPTDRPRPAVQTYRGAKQSLLLPKTLMEALQALSRREGVTLFMTLLAAFQTLLHRYTGQDDLLVGSPIAGRTRIELEGLIGFFVNTLVLRTDMSGNPTFRELLGRVREVALGAYAHQDLPFEKLVEELQPARDLSHSPLFQVMFILQNVPRAALELAGLTLTPVEVDSGTAKFELTLSMAESADGLRGVWEYNTDLFEAATICRLAGHFQTLLEGIVTDPAQRLSALPLLTDVERQQLLVGWNATQAEYPQETCLHELIEAQVERTPDAVAVVFDGESLTYRELNARANRLAHYLRRRGVGPEVLVGISLERSLEMVVGLLGILKAGGAYMPLDPAYPPARLAFMLEDSQAPVLLTQQRSVEGLLAPQAQVVCTDADWAAIAREPEENPANGTAAAQLAYVIYTSGSTGQPKGVQIPHRAVVNFLRSMCQQPGLTAQDTLLAVTTLSFDIAALELFLPLSVGARVVLVSRAVATDGRQLLQTLADTKATVMQATPATWHLLLEAGWAGSPQLTVLCGGEALPRELAQQLLARAAAVWNLYGPTETTIWSAVAKVEPGDGPVPIGRPIANTQFYLLDRHLQLVPIGVPGELHIGGAGVAQGYLNRPELTAERFIVDPFSDEPTARLYRTGDLARYRPDGALECLGRIDQQVKLRGFRIEPGEIEAVLTQCPGVQQAVVLVREDLPGDKRLVAYLIPDREPVPTPSELQSFLKKTHPDYMVPSAFVFLDAWPLTPNGKVDRRALPAPEWARPEQGRAVGEPSDMLELQLTKIWEEVLGTRPIGVQDDFFALGGHSLLAVRLFVQIEKTFGRKLPLATLFQARTVEQLANVLRQDGWSPPWSSLVPIQPRGSQPPFFCVHAHGGHVLVFKDLARRLGPDQPFYGIQAYGLNGDQARHRRVEDMAAHYLEEIQTLQPEGPYFLGGYCFGGRVAFEMAQQLHAQGQQIALLALLDAYAPGYPKRKPWFERRVKLRVNYHLSNLRCLGSKGKLSYLLEKGGIGRTRVETKLKKIACRLYLGIGLPLPRALQEIQEPGRRPFDPYVPSVYPGRITLFRPSQQPAGCYHEPEMGWGGLAAEGLEVYEVPGKFASIILEPSVRVMAEQLQACLREARTTKNSAVQK